MNDIVAQHDHLLRSIRADHPGLEIHIQPLPPEALTDLPAGLNAEGMAELVISSTGPGHYAVTLPGLDEPNPEFRLFFVNVNDMPGDGVLLGTFPSAGAAVRAAIGHETNNGTPISLLDSPLTYAAYEEHIMPTPLENWPADKVAALVDELQHSFPALRITGASAPMPDHPQTHCGSLTLINPADPRTIYAINLQQTPGRNGPGYTIGVHWTDPATGQSDGFAVDPRCPNLTDAVYAIHLYETSDRMQSWFELPVVLQDRQAAREAAALGALDHPPHRAPSNGTAAQTAVHPYTQGKASGLDR